MTKDAIKDKFKSFSPWKAVGSKGHETLVVHFEEMNPRGEDYTPPPFNAKSLRQALENDMLVLSKGDRTLMEDALNGYGVARAKHLGFKCPFSRSL